eukprot:CAMPEP_0204362590 /NCGR_PEP_ID=MMETSP0469-20131031/39724_1 /ASSEMBLY_ACC=CAM_ASM_000384 /TAXON_ID=2969 /ORGANISM="Oxyrrhis marina" /LENGTH=415 /DNA_ID=CAMNT_0051351201 /DNA_START=89 /DNA_END=1333 /DNA_ORIENTATION=-
MALARFMEGITQVQTMISRFGDAALQLNGFTNASIRTHLDKGRWEAAADLERFKARTAVMFSYLSAIAFYTLRNGDPKSLKFMDALINERGEARDLGGRHSRRASALSFDAATRALETSTWGCCRRRDKCLDRETIAQQYLTNPLISSLNHKVKRNPLGEVTNEPPGWKSEYDLEDWRTRLVVFHEPTARQKVEVLASSEKVCTVCNWLTEDVMFQVHRGNLLTPAPILTRSFQELSNGMLGFNQACKIALVPFPFPFAQMVSLSLCFLLWIFPIVVEHFTQSVIFTPVIVCLVVTGYWGLNEIAIELENPFGNDDNDLPLEAVHNSFMRFLDELLCAPAISNTHSTWKDLKRVEDSLSTSGSAPTPGRALGVGAPTPLGSTGSICGGQNTPSRSDLFSFWFVPERLLHKSFLAR